MGKVYTGASTSIDGYVSGPEFSGFDKLFRWYKSGDVAYTVPTGAMTVHLTPASAAYFSGMVQATGALVVGRKLYDMTNGWGGQHPMGVHTVVLTHRPLEDNEHFTFCSDGIEKAVEIARSHAGDKGVGLNSGEVARQAIDAGLVDEICLDLVPVLLGGGTPFFAPGKGYQLEGPLSIVEGVEVTHLRYKVRYAG
ncbi:dihydrofolate reductase family protein [Nocardia sp. NRRL S-836]|uniref:dihydrofolate reductase family protein n=1 Tax=Nocardia sp. NRRL S-836 TaxID=1519492 RepID=UPI0006B00362|nr:dihydrofolate reductase family protein [Nocardia sp. NRRL S-836]KOV81449.1 deaminase [Nocardia sp. NRRL S-836]